MYKLDFVTTNNIAEYEALILVLKDAKGKCLWWLWISCPTGKGQISSKEGFVESI